MPFAEWLYIMQLSTHGVTGIKSNGEYTSNFVDSAGFKNIPEFFVKKEKIPAAVLDSTKSKKGENHEKAHSERHNFRIVDDNLGQGTQKENFRANIAAIQLLKKCSEENRYATSDEQEILSKYVGWGGLTDAFDNAKASWSYEYLELKTVLTEEEYSAARQSALTAFYTLKIRKNEGTIFKGTQ